MPRQPRIEYEGAFYHVMNRGDRKEAIFEDDADREMFLKTLGEVCERSGWRIYAWILMSNHYHLVVETPEGNLVAGMKWFQNTYTRRLNVRHRKWGHVFGGRYKAVVVQSDPEEAGDYLTTLMDYVHLNPARAGLVNWQEGEVLLGYRWSSLQQGYAVIKTKRAPWIAVKEGLELFGYSDKAKDRRGFVERLERRGKEGLEVEPPHDGLQNTLQRGWYWGSQAFREKLLKMVKPQRGNRNYRSSGLGRERERKVAEDWLEAGRNHFGIEGALTESGREVRKAIAWALYRKTNESQAWIAESLGLHSAANVSQQVRRFQKLVESKDAALRKGQLREWIKIVKNC